jgi:uncharacterized protein involved in exopolysaccharide biosynthesis
MAVGNPTTRDQLEKVQDLLRRTLRYLWIAVVVGAVGGTLSVAYALTRPHEYESETVLLYREMISQSMLQDRDVNVASSALSSRYREMLMSRQNLARVVGEFNLYPDIVEKDGTMAAAALMRTKVAFRDRGSGTFHISFTGNSPEEAQKVVKRLAEILKEEDNRVRREQAEVTSNFLNEQKTQADIALAERKRQQVEFLTKHPEFAEDNKGGSGAAIRGSQKKPSGDRGLSALLRQRDRIAARLKNPDKPVAVSGGNRSPARIAAEAKLRQADEAVANAEQELADKLRRFTDKHPDVTTARNRVAEAKKSQREMAKALAAVAEDVPVLSAPFDKAALESELAKIDREIATTRARQASGTKDKSDLADELVSLETEWSTLERSVDEALIKVQALETKTFTAQIAASSELAESAQLSVIDEAFLPATPAGKPRKLLALAGMVLFGGLGLALAVGLALVDDRVYRRSDLEALDIAPVLVEIPAAKKKRRRGKRG